MDGKSDLISRQAAIDALKDWYDGIIISSFRGLEKVIKALPSAVPERKKGKWISVHPLQSDDPGAYICSECKTGMWEIIPSMYHYCPNCGCQMEGED